MMASACTDEERPHQISGSWLDNRAENMNPRDRLVIRLPMSQLWDDHGPVEARQVRPLGRNDIAALLRDGPIQFVVANLGKKLQWVEVRDSMNFWKDEVISRLLERHAAEAGFRLEDYPGEYCYSAHEWSANGLPPIILLEMHH